MVVNPPDDQKMQFYAAARAEVTQRIALRDQTLIAYVVAAGGYLGLVAPSQVTVTLTPQNVFQEIAIVVVLPVISLVFTYVILQHHIMIGVLGNYLRSLFPPDFNLWERFYTQSRDKGYLRARTFSQALLLVLPLFYTFFFLLRTIPIMGTDALLQGIVPVVLMFDVFVLAAIVRLHFWAYGVRRESDRMDKTSPGIPKA